MKIPIWSKASASTRNTALGGAIAGAVVGVESGASWFIAGYPQILKDKLAPVVPRNGALVANLAPAGYALMTKRKHASGKKADMANGMIFYDLPKLLDQFAYNIGYQMGIPAVGARLGVSTPMRLNIRPAMNNGVVGTGYPKASSGAGKYAMKVSSTRPSTGSLGRYR